MEGSKTVFALQTSCGHSKEFLRNL